MDAGEGLARGTSPFARRASTDADRVDVVRRLALAGGRRPALDRLTDLAARLLGSATAQVSLVDDGHSVVGWSGPESTWSRVTIPAEHSICSIAVATVAPVLVDDAPADQRTQDLPPVTSGEIGAYLGVPLVSSGHVVGALCAIDPEPRSWSAQDLEVLESLAGAVVAELELAALEAAYENDRMLWEHAVDAAGVGVFDWDMTTGRLRWDDRLLEVFGQTRDSFGGTIEAFRELVHPDDRERVDRALGAAVDEVGEFSASYRVPIGDGVVRWVTARGRALAGTEGRTVRVVGAAYDTTAVEEGEARVSRVMESMPTAFYHLDTRWRLTYANPEATRLLGGIGNELVGRVLWDLFPVQSGLALRTVFARAVQTGEPVTFETTYPPPLDGRCEVHAWPSTDGLSVYLVDVTARRRAQHAVEVAVQRADLLAEVTRSLTDTLDLGEAADRLARLVVPALGDWCTVGLLADHAPAGTRRPQHLSHAACWHADAGRLDELEQFSRLRHAALSDTSLTAQALRTGRPALAADADEAVAGLHPGAAADLCRALDPATAAVLPLSGRGRVIGALTVCRRPGRPPFSDDDVAALSDIAARAGLALDNLRAYREQSDLAETLQRSLLTAPPQRDDVEIAVRYEPAARLAQVGGDWYDAWGAEGEGLTLVIGDVVGHDTAAAAQMGQVRGLLRGIAVGGGTDGPADVLAGLDSAIVALRLETTATAVVSCLDDGTLRWSNAGHPPPVLATPGPDGSVQVRLLWAERADLLLGLDPQAPRRETSVDLPPGSTLLMCTDGLFERRGESMDVGLARLADALGDLVAAGLPLEDLADALLRRMLPEQQPEDDVALVVVRPR